MEEIVRHNDEFIDKIEAIMQEANNPIECPLRHIFTPGLYAREIFMPANQLVTSKSHKTEHIFIVSKGVVEVSIDGGKSEMIAAPYTGITRAGTRRVLLIHEDTIWTTVHANPDNETDIKKLEARLVEHNNPLL